MWGDYPGLGASLSLQGVGKCGPTGVARGLLMSDQITH